MAPKRKGSAPEGAGQSFHRLLNIKSGLSFDDALYEAGRSRFRAIFLTSLTTIAGLAPLIFEQSRQAQFLIPMAISIAYGIGFATVLTLVLLPIFLSFNNFVKMNMKWLWTGDAISKEEVERAIKEQKEGFRLQEDALLGTSKGANNIEQEQLNNADK